MTRADALYRANTFEAQSAYYAWVAAQLEPGTLADIFAEMAAARARWAKQLRTQNGRVA